MKKLLSLVLISSICLTFAGIAAGCSKKQYGIEDKTASSSIPSASIYVSSAAESAVPGTDVSSAPNRPSKAETAQATLGSIDSNAQNIESMLNGIAMDNASIPSGNDSTAEIDSLAGEIDSYLVPETDNIAQLNK